MMLHKLAYFHHSLAEFRQLQQPHFQLITQKTINLSPFTKLNHSHRRSDNCNYLAVTCAKIEEINENKGKSRKLIQEFNPEIPIEEAFTPPSSWYTDPDFYSLELSRVFYKGWQAVGYISQIKQARNFFTGRLGSIEYLVCRDEKGTLNAFHNVCRHHASLLASGTGKKSCFVCPYHGWTYGLDGALVKGTRIAGIKNFQVNEMGLVPLKVATWGPFVLINLEGVMPKKGLDPKAVGDEWLGSAAEVLSANGVDTSLDYVCRRVYTLECNWKVFCDNYLDGGYHVPYAHTGLAAKLQLDSYLTKMYEKVSIQSCGGATSNSGEKVDRIGSEAMYAFVYPNFMINRYGPWMDTNLVLPLGPRQCQVVFDYFLDSSLRDDSAFIEQSLEDSVKVQVPNHNIPWRFMHVCSAI